LKPARVRVTPGVEKRRETLDAIRRRKRQSAERAACDGRGQHEVAQPRARDEEHAEARRDYDNRRAEVGLREQQ
jgi:hypothetical protein